MATVNWKKMYTAGYVKRVKTETYKKAKQELQENNIVIDLYGNELKNAFKSYDNFKNFILDNFGIDIDYLDYLERR